MPNKTSPKIDLSARSRKIVEEITRRGSTEYRLVVRALLLLAMAEGVGNNELARKHKMDRVVVRKWRNRWVDLVLKLKAEPDRDLVQPLGASSTQTRILQINR